MTTNQVQSTVPQTWARQQIQELTEFNTIGRRRRRSLVTIIINSIQGTDDLDQEHLRYLSDNSFDQLQQLVIDTRPRLQSSKIYLRNPTENQHLLDDCFKPDINLVAKKQRLFNLVPQPTYTKKYVKVTNDTRQIILRSLQLHEYINGENTLVDLLSLDKVRPREGMVFSKFILTDGYATSIPFDKATRNNTALPDLEHGDFEQWELDYCNVWGADPGVNSVYVASNGSSDDIYDYAVEHQGATTDNGDEIPDDIIAAEDIHEYKTRAGYTMTMNKINAAKSGAIQTLEGNLETNRTATVGGS